MPDVYRILKSSLNNIADAIRAKTGRTGTMTPAQMVEEIENIETGATIADGILVRARNTSGMVTEVDKYGNCGAFEFGSGTTGYRDFIYGNLETVNLYNCTVLGDSSMRNRYIQTINGLESVTNCGSSCFMGSGLAAIILPAAASVGTNCFRSLYQTCKSIFLPVLQTGGTYIFQESTRLETVQIGSIGHPAPTNLNQPFYGCNQQGLTITGYQTGANADNLLNSYRLNARNATIIIKASEDTIYNGTTYAAGDTILTNTP